MLDSKDDRSQVYLPEICIGCGTCVAACPKGALVIGSVGAVARGLIDKDFIEKRKGECVFCSICARICPTGALEVRTRGFAETDESYQHAGLGTGDSGTHFTSFFNISKSSSRRSYESLTPISMPDWSIPSRSATDWKTDCDVSFVLLPGIATNLAVWRMTCPFSGSPSNSNVPIILSGACDLMIHAMKRKLIAVLIFLNVPP